MVRLQFTARLAFASFLSSTATSTQEPLLDESRSPSTRISHESVAIIGAGISGALVAFELQERAYPSSQYKVTMFEKGSNMGGRIRSVSLPQNRRLTAEAGSSHFYVEDQCIIQAIKNVGLEFDRPDPNAPPDTMSVWNGTNLWQSSTCDSKTSSWADLWKYGLSPWKYRRAMREVSNRWQLFAGIRFVGNVTRELESYALGGFVSQSATQYANDTGISPRYSSDLIDPCVGTRFMQDLVGVHSLAALMAAQKTRVGPIRGSKIRLFERLIKLSDSELRLNKTVIRIGPGQERRYRITCSEQSSHTVSEYQEFDKVVLAAPLSSANVNLGGLSTLNNAALPQYSEVHVTHFLTPASLSPTFFNLSSETCMTDKILVTGNASSHVNLYSISRSTECWIDREYCQPSQPCDQLVCENLYRVVSGKHIEDRDLVGMVGELYDKDKLLHEQNMSWVHRQAWSSAVPAHRPTAGFLEQIQIAPGLFYLGAAEEIISSMEMSCRMAKNVAERLRYGY